MRYDGHVQEFRRISMDPEVMGGKPCTAHMRVTVGMIVEALAAGRTVEQSENVYHAVRHTLA